MAHDPEAEAFTEQERAALAFAKELCIGELAVENFERLRKVFNETDVVEIVAFCAWQFGGPAALTSWGAENYKVNGKVDLDALPVRLAYADAAQSEEALPPIPEPPLHSLDDLQNRAEQRLSPPLAWLRFLSSHPTLLSTWGAMYEMLVEDGAVASRIKQLQRVLIADRFDCPSWAPEQSSSLQVAGIDARERDAVNASDFSIFLEDERAALCYADALILFGKVDDDVFQNLKESFSWSEIVELGFAVATQAGAARVLSALLADK